LPLGSTASVAPSSSGGRRHASIEENAIVEGDENEEPVEEEISSQPLRRGAEAGVEGGAEASARFDVDMASQTVTC
jgi:hypothetical protein